MTSVPAPIRSITHPRIRIFLIMQQYPHDHDRIQRWIDEGFEWRFTCYLEDHPDEPINPNDDHQITALLGKVVTYERQSIAA